MDFGELKELIRILETSDLAEIEIEEEGRRMRLTKQAKTPAVQVPLPYAVNTAVEALAPPAAAPIVEEENDLKLEPGLVAINSPMVGTFFTSPAPGEPSFVQLNDSVDAEQTVCIVEAMKIMNEVVADQPGTIVKILVENGDSVEYGQPLVVLRPL